MNLKDELKARYTEARKEYKRWAKAAEAFSLANCHIMAEDEYAKAYDRMATMRKYWHKECHTLGNIYYDLFNEPIDVKEKNYDKT